MPSTKSLVNPTYTPMSLPPGGFKTFQSFYPFYLGEHSLPTTRRLHLIGTSIAVTSFTRVTLSLIPIVLTGLARSVPAPSKNNGINPLQPSHTGTGPGPFNNLKLSYQLAYYAMKFRFLDLTRSEAITWLAGGVVGAYAFAWISHFFVEKNKPATFKYPVWSLRGDLKMWWEVITLQRDF
ncbi:uncharacterized protein IL334_002101 [Kwoniella shivajii]|uniref:Uncharacterized protein n=1 Tax=Kwoniella shivajii TaxID=564305 RepID=A0ABZ1CUE1_9TREE|nr:hypothetical protein IL334_002101 [Kwoniella shivajii]